MAPQVILAIQTGAINMAVTVNIVFGVDLQVLVVLGIQVTPISVMKDKWGNPPTISATQK